MLSSPACFPNAQPSFGLAQEIRGKYVLAHASSVNGERSSDSYLRRPSCEDLPGTFTCSPWGHRAPRICLDLPIPLARLRQRHLGDLRKVIGENRTFVPERQGLAGEHVIGDLTFEQAVALLAPRGVLFLGRGSK